MLTYFVLVGEPFKPFKKLDPSWGRIPGPRPDHEPNEPVLNEGDRWVQLWEPGQQKWFWGIVSESPQNYLTAMPETESKPKPAEPVPSEPAKEYTPPALPTVEGAT